MAITYQPNPKQSEFHADPRERRWFCGGYGSGKTTAGVYEAFTLGWQDHPRFEGILAAPTYPLLSSVLLNEWARNIPRDYWSLREHPKKGTFIELVNGTVIWCRSTTKPGNNEGINAAWFVFDEAPREHNVESYNVLVSRVRRGYPGRRLSVVLTGPPAGPGHWTATEFGTGPGASRTGTNWHWHDGRHAVIRSRTRDNPKLPDGYEDGLRNRPGASKNWCRQYLDAEFVASEGQVWDSFTRDTHVVEPDAIPSHFRRVVIGVDWGFSHAGVMLVVGQTSDGTMYVLHEEVHKGMVVSDSGWLGVAKKLRDDYSPDCFTADPSQPGYMLSMRQALGGNPIVLNAQNDVAEGIRRVAVAFDPQPIAETVRNSSAPPKLKPRMFVSSKCPKTISEIERYTYRIVRGVPTEQPVEVGDDACDALRYAVMALTRSQ